MRQKQKIRRISNIRVLPRLRSTTSEEYLLPSCPPSTNKYDPTWVEVCESRGMERSRSTWYQWLLAVNDSQSNEVKVKHRTESWNLQRSRIWTSLKHSWPSLPPYMMYLSPTRLPVWYPLELGKAPLGWSSDHCKRLGSEMSSTCTSCKARAPSPPPNT